MAINFPGTKHIERLSDLPSTTAVTVLFWVKFNNFTNGPVLFDLGLNNANGDNCIELYCNGSGQLGLWNGSSSVEGTTLSTGVWYFLGLTCSGTGSTDLKSYLNAVQDSAMTGGSYTAEVASIGGWPGDTQRFNGDMSPIKIFNAVLTVDEIKKEMASTRCLYSGANVKAWIPGNSDTSFLVDHSGKGDWSEVGTGSIVKAPSAPVSTGARYTTTKVVPTSQTHNADRTEAATSAESSTASASFSSSREETIASAESSSVVAAFISELAEALSTGDLSTTGTLLSSDREEALTSGESSSVLAAFSSQASETQTPTEVSTASRIAVSSLSESITSSESSLAVADFISASAESVSISESTTAGNSINASLSESTTLGESSINSPVVTASSTESINLRSIQSGVHSGIKVSVSTRSFYCVPGADGKTRTGDPVGSYGNAIKRTSAIAAIVTCQTAQDLLPALNSPSSVVFTSTQLGFWQIASNVYGAVGVVSNDGLTFTITYTPTTRMSIYVAARCVNAGNLTAGLPTTGIAVCRQHPGMRGVIKCGAGWDHASMRAGFDYAKTLSPSSGYAFVIKNGTYTDNNNRIYYSPGAPANQQYYMPPPGAFTTSTQGAHNDPVYTITHWSSVMAETPAGVVIDGQGVRAEGVYMYGDTAFEWDESPTGGNLYQIDNDWHLQGAGFERRGIHIAGIAVKNTVGIGWNTQYCDHIFFEYGAIFDACSGMIDYNNAAIQFQNSLDCLAENMHSGGGGRYLFSTYQSKRVIYRRLFGRYDWNNSVFPFGALTPYRQRQFRVQNYLFFDSDNLDEFNVGESASDTGLSTLASTDVWDYARDVNFDRGLSFNNTFGFVFNDTRNIDQSIITCRFTDLSSWYQRQNHQGNGFTLFGGGPSELRRITSVYCDGRGFGNTGITCWGGSSTTTKSIIYKYNHVHDGAGRGDGAMYYSPGGTPPNEHRLALNDSYVFDASYATEKTGSVGSINVDVDTTTDPKLNGMRYPGRIEVGTRFKAEVVGADNFYRAMGRHGAFWGEVGDAEDTGQNWLAEAMLEYYLPLYRSYSYTGPTNTLGTQTLSGNRGGVTIARLLRDYIKSVAGRDVPFITDLAATSNSGILKISWGGFATEYQLNITAINIYIDGEMVQTIAVNEHAAEFPGMVVGSKYKIKMSAVHSSFGESGLSEEIEVTVQ